MLLFTFTWKAAAARKPHLYYSSGIKEKFDCNIIPPFTHTVWAQERYCKMSLSPILVTLTRDRSVPWTLHLSSHLPCRFHICHFLCFFCQAVGCWRYHVLWCIRFSLHLCDFSTLSSLWILPDNLSSFLVDALPRPLNCYFTPFPLLSSLPPSLPIFLLADHFTSFFVKMVECLKKH